MVGAMVEVMELFKPVFIDQRITLNPSDFASLKGEDPIQDYLKKKISAALEGRCCMHGYVREGSTELMARSMGQAEHGRFTGDFLYYCKIKILCLLPEAGQVLNARILKMNKMGAYALLVDGGNPLEAMRILIPRDGYIGVEEFDKLQVDQDIRVRIMRSRFQINDAFIQAIGQLESIGTVATPEAEEEAEAEAEEAEAEEAEEEEAESEEAETDED